METVDSFDTEIKSLENSLKPTQDVSINPEVKKLSSILNLIIKITISLVVSALLLFTFKPVWLYDFEYDSKDEKINKSVMKMKTFGVFLILTMVLFFAYTGFTKYAEFAS